MEGGGISISKYREVKIKRKISRVGQRGLRTVLGKFLTAQSLLYTNFFLCSEGNQDYIYPCNGSTWEGYLPQGTKVRKEDALVVVVLSRIRARRLDGFNAIEFTSENGAIILTFEMPR